mmetsp:Transcript_32407/g.85024  ORF Transcript_32407/g.85024 Transcript_32407/m.85024 type:complete len:237 (+) Transcript_32407:431-1141(+)
MQDSILDIRMQRQACHQHHRGATDPQPQRARAGCARPLDARGTQESLPDLGDAVRHGRRGGRKARAEVAGGESECILGRPRAVSVGVGVGSRIVDFVRAGTRSRLSSARAHLLLAQALADKGRRRSVQRPRFDECDGAALQRPCHRRQRPGERGKGLDAEARVADEGERNPVCEGERCDRAVLPLCLPQPCDRVLCIPRAHEGPRVRHGQLRSRLHPVVVARKRLAEAAARDDPRA